MTINYSYRTIYINLIIWASKKTFLNPKKFLKFKKQFCSQNKVPQPTNADLRELYNNLVSQKIIKRNKSLEKVMLSRAIRTQSGVAIVAVLTKPFSCPGKCIFCPTEKNMPKSYLSNEPAVMRAIMNKFSPYKQVQSRIKALELNGHSTDKIELIVMGGTFSYLPKHYQKWFIKECFRACNEYNKKSLRQRRDTNKISELLKNEQHKNEVSDHRIIGLTLETRPDYITEKEILNFRNLGCTRVELGVQSIFDDILKKNNRGHLTQSTAQATKLLKESGFKINYHMMPGLYGSTLAKDFKMFSKLFSDERFQPDMLKIYPTVVIKNSKLYKLWKLGKYKAMSDKQFEKLIIKIKNRTIPPYVRIQRLIRDVPLPSIEAGPKISNLRQIIEPKTNCQCIRCREIKGEFSKKNKLTLNRIDYLSSNGKEIFLQFIDKNNHLYALLRLRINDRKTTTNHFIPILKNSAIIREVHTYGKLTSIGKQDKNSPQHIGLGRKLLQEAEKIAKKELTELGIPKSKQKITVISGIGVRNYYRKNGYRLRDTYMVKKLF